MAFQKAQKHQHKLRIGLAGPTGSGKTFTAMKIASAIAAKEGKRFAVIDTEHGSASLYADHFDFDVLELTSFAPDRYIEAINEAGRAASEYACVVVDSFTHAWSGKDGALEQVDRKANGAGGSFNAWRDVTPQHTRMVEAILSCPIHLIGTLRSKMAYEVDTDPKTKRVTVRKIGLQPIQREGMEYEFDVFADLDVDNTLYVSKTRLSTLSGYSALKAGDELGLMLWEWANGGDAAPPRPEPEAAPAQSGRPTPPQGQRRLTPQEQYAGLMDGSWEPFKAELLNRGLTTTQLGAVTANPTQWLKDNPTKTLKDLLDAVADNARGLVDEYVTEPTEAEANGYEPPAQEPEEAAQMAIPTT